MKMNVPNTLTIIRVLLIPFFVAFMLCNITAYDNYIALAIFIVASLTDTLDGYLARKNNQVTNFGKFMDPLADKLLVIAAMAMFCEWGLWPAWALMAVLAREFAVTGLRLVAAGKGTVIAAGWSGKVKTASTMVGLCLLMAFPHIQPLRWAVIWVVVATTLYSGVEYFARNWKCLWN